MENLDSFVDSVTGFKKIVLEGRITDDDFQHFCEKMGKTLQELDLSKASFEGNEISGDRFADWCELTSITLPRSVIEINLLSLKSCHRLASISVPPDNPVLASENGVLFNDDKTLLIFYPNARQDDNGYVIPDTVVRIETFAFYGCRCLSSVFIPASVKEIPYHVFNGCPNLTNITVHPDNPVYASENGILFNKDKTELIYYPEGRQDACNIPDSYKEISEYFIDVRIALHELSKKAFDDGGEKEERHYTGEELMESLRKKMPLDIKIRLNPELRLEQALKDAKVEDIARIRKLTIVGVFANSDIEYINSTMYETLHELNISDASIEGNSITGDALSRCEKLTCISISDTITEIANNAFGTALTTITVHPDNPVFASKNGVLFNKIDITSYATHTPDVPALPTTIVPNGHRRPV